MSNAFSDKLPIDKPQDCMSRVISGTTSSFVAGGIIGALTANWGDIPQVLQDKPLPALKRTGIYAHSNCLICIKCCSVPSLKSFACVAGAIMGRYGLTFAAVGLAYTGIDCAAETFRGVQLLTTLHTKQQSNCLTVKPNCKACSTCCSALALDNQWS